MEKKTIITLFKIEFTEMDNKGNSNILVTNTWNSEDEIIFKYYGPYALMLQTVSNEALGRVIMSKLKEISREYNAKQRL